MPEKAFLLLIAYFYFRHHGIQPTASNRQDRGKVSDERGEPLPGVNVLVKGTQTGVSNRWQRQLFDQCLPGAVLVFRALNYQTEEATIGSQPVINIKLKSIAKDLDEVVCPVYGKQRSREVTGSIVQT